MASGPIVGGDDGAKEKQRYSETKVYTRKAYKGLKNKANVLTAVVPHTAPTTTTANIDNNTSNVENDSIAETGKNENDSTKQLSQTTSLTLLPEDGNSTKQQPYSRPDIVLDDSSTLNSQQDEPSSPHHQQDEHSNPRLQQDEHSNPRLQQDEHSSPHHQQDEPSSPHHQQDEHASPRQQQDEPLSSNRQEVATPIARELPSGNGVVKPGLDNRIKINLSSRSKQETLELKRKLENELDTVRSLVRKIEVKLGQIGDYGRSNPLVSERIDNGVEARRVQLEAAPAVPREPIRHQLNLSVLENSHGATGSVEKEKRTPKANQLYRNSEFLLAKDKFPPAESNRKSKLNGKKQVGGETGHGFGMGSKFLKCCGSLLSKLMNHKHGWVFNAPVDVQGLGLHDYFSIISHPMDLGTVKTRLNKNWYKTPKEFAEDVRLTFYNAMRYNPPGQDVHVMAEQLSKIFEERWAIIESDYNREMRYVLDYGPTISAPPALSRRAPALPPPSLDMRRILDRSESMTHPPRSMSITPSSRTPVPKKPKAKDLYKRDMTYEEKQKLSTNLQSLPPEKLDDIVQIIKKRNSALSQHDNEIEVDIDSVDAETLWELDRFVTNYRKNLSKNKRKAELAVQRAEFAKNAQQKVSDMVEVPNENLADGMDVPPSLPAPVDRPLDNGSRSSSSSSSSSDSGSSSSDSDSDSSSASGSDAGSQGT